MAEPKYDPEALDQSLAELVLAAQAARDLSRGRISSGYERRSLTGWSTNGDGLAHLRTNATPPPRRYPLLPQSRRLLGLEGPARTDGPDLGGLLNSCPTASISTCFDWAPKRFVQAYEIF